MSKPLLLLLVEDSEDDAELLVCHIERHNCDVEWLRVDTPEAMSIALDRQQWDIILADYSLPKFSATAALRLLQSKALDIPFIIVSGNIGEETAVAAMKAGAHDYIMKGNLARLVPAIEREIEEAASRSECQRIQLELKESEARWQLALDGTNDGLWDWDIKNHTVFLSARWKAMLGYAENEIGNRFEEWANRVHSDDVKSVMRSLQEHLARESEFYRIEHRLRCKDGSYKWILSRGKALWDEVGAAIRMVGSHTDITSTKQMEDTLRQQAESLTAANRIKDEFLAVVSHELRAPLNAILGWSQILRTRKFNTTTIWEILETIERNAKWQQHLIEDLLDVSRIVQGTLDLQVAPVYLPSIIAATIEAVQPIADAKRIQLKFTVDPAWEDEEIERQILLLVDSKRLQQVFWNLLTNAIKFSPEDRQVDICLSLVADETNSQAQIYSYAQIQIIDRGRGISAEFLPHVFDGFRQENSSSTRSYGGLGLGLAIVRHIVEMHGGTVGVASSGVGRGATFTVQLPLPKQELSQKHRQPSATDLCLETSEPYPLMGRKVLAVDDEPDTLELLAVALTEYGADTVVASSVRDALVAFTQFKPDLIVCDLGMPGEDGYTLIHQIRMQEIELGTHTPAIALTGFARDSDRDRAIAAGFQIHLSKPVNPYQLMSLILKLTKDNYLAGKI